MLWIYYIVLNFITIFAYAIDKRRAVRGRWRIPERLLLGLAFFGGALGAWLGMQLCHHKTSKKKFVILVPLFLVLHIALVVTVLIKI